MGTEGLRGLERCPIAPCWQWLCITVPACGRGLTSVLRSASPRDVARAAAFAEQEVLGRGPLIQPALPLLGDFLLSPHAMPGAGRWLSRKPAGLFSVCPPPYGQEGPWEERERAGQESMGFAGIGI